MGRMNFGADRPPAYWDPKIAVKVEEAVGECLKAIARGDREWGAPLKVQLLYPFYTIIPNLLEWIILRQIKRTTYRDE